MQKNAETQANVQDNAIEEADLQDSAQVKSGKGEGQLSLSDQALSVLASAMNDPTASAASRNDAAAKVYAATKGAAGKASAISSLTRDEILQEIVRTKAMLGH